MSFLPVPRIIWFQVPTASISLPFLPNSTCSSATAPKARRSWSAQTLPETRRRRWQSSFPTAISTNGQYALFESFADNLVTNDANNAADVFLRDVVNNTTTLVSISTNAQSGSGTSQSSTMTPDARYVAFSSIASNLVAGDVNGIADIFVRDMLAGTTTLASPNATKVANSNSRSDAPVITPDGRYVAFLSTAGGLATDASTAGDVYVRDLIGGLATIDGASAPARGSSTTAFFLSHAISDDGQYAIFESGSATRLTGKIFRFNLSTAALDTVASNLQTAAALNMEFRDTRHNPRRAFCNIRRFNKFRDCFRRLSVGRSI